MQKPPSFILIQKKIAIMIAIRQFLNYTIRNQKYMEVELELCNGY